MPMPGDDTYGDDFVGNTVDDIVNGWKTPEGSADLVDEPGVDDGEQKPTAAPKPGENAAPVAGPTPPAPAPAPGQIVPGQNSVGKPLPKSWKRDMAPHWEKLPPEVHEYVYAREADVMRGIQTYQEAAQNWGNLLQPFAPLLQQYPEIQPVPMLQGLLSTHISLSSPSVPMEQKVARVRQILADYGIDLGNTPTSGETNPELQSLRAELQQTKQTLQTLQQGFQNNQRQAYEIGLAEKQKMVQAFAADPKNEYFEEVGNDIFRLLQTGAAVDLPTAYEMACWSNPVVRGKMLAKQQAANPTSVQRNGKNGQFVNLDNGDPPPRRTRTNGSISDTVDQIIASHYTKQ